MKRILLLFALAFAACDNEVARNPQAEKATPTPKPAWTPPTPIPNKLKGTTLDRATPHPGKKADPNAPAPYVNPLEQKPK